MIDKYRPPEFEKKLAKKWDKDGVYVTKNQVTSDKKRYILSMFPYPSGAGLHVGHVRIYTGTDILARYFRMKGYYVLNPMGWDAFGLPAENAAIKAKKNPIDMVPDNIATFKRQMISLGLSFDWSREFATIDPQYYKWTQWLFLQLYKLKNKKGERLVYKKQMPIQWCPFCKTGLANEEVLADGTHERCGHKTEEKLLPQWVFRITDYADRLLEDLIDLDWPEGILQMQRNWIGKKEGMIIHHKVDGLDYILDTFTAYPAWSFADTFIVVSPEHPFVEKVKSQNSKVKNDIQAYQNEVKKESQQDRMSADQEKTGVFTGYYAEDPFRPGEKMPIWIANFALMDFGTGAVRCSIHDPRDVEFANKYQIPLRACVISKTGDYVNAHDNKGILVDSGPFTGKEVADIIPEFIDWIEKEKIGVRKTSYHLRDWIFSRQRYWGEPFPLIYCDKCGDENGVVEVAEDQLPVELPYVKSYEPTDTGESPLSQIADWAAVKCPNCGGLARRETDTMPNWAGSCWYFIAFSFWKKENASPKSKIQNSHNDKLNLFDIWTLKFGFDSNLWLPVDWYLGGAEHAVLHLLYARFWTKAFYDLGLTSITEPFMKLRNVGMVLAEDHRKMSKSFGNVINPDEIVNEYGADTLRIYEAFMAPFNIEVAWSTAALQGGYRFLTRIWQIYHDSAKITEDEKKGDPELSAELQKLILKITSDITNVKFNTAIAALMSFLNQWEAQPVIPSVVEGSDTNQSRKLTITNAKVFLQLLAPFAPFITDQIWHDVYKEKKSIHLSAWPEADKSKLTIRTVKIPVQVDGKLRAVLAIDASLAEQDSVVSVALKNDKVIRHIQNRQYSVHYVAGKILNFVCK